MRKYIIKHGDKLLKTEKYKQITNSSAQLIASLIKQSEFQIF